MCDLASQKVQNDQVHNLKILRQSVGVTNFKPASISACLCIHSLYTFPNPANVIQRIYHWMKPGGVGIFVDPGRTVNVLDWQLAIGWQMIKQHGLWKTIQLLKEGKEISHQNRQISKLHAEGIYWKHSHEEFCDTVRAAGFTITESAYCFRGISDMVVVEK